MPWTSRYIDLFKFDQMRPEYLAINPRGMVPTLVHDGKPVRESSVINEYIDAAFTGPPLTPPDPWASADASRLSVRRGLLRHRKADHGEIHPSEAKEPLERRRIAQAGREPADKILPGCSRPRGPSRETGQELAAARATIDELLDQLERTLAPGPWIVGSQLSLAEISVAPYMFRLAALGADQFWSSQRRPRVNTWYRNLAARPAFKTAMSSPTSRAAATRRSALARRSPRPSDLAPLSGSNREARKLYLLSFFVPGLWLPPSI